MAIAMAGSSFQGVPSSVVPNVIGDSLEYILSDIGNEIIRIVDLNQLGTDIRTAAYMVAIQNVFNTLFYQE
ncbi:hypothetical protein NQ318_013120, partial [Aromia moschata]